jgi:rare lipoprotein A
VFNSNGRPLEVAANCRNEKGERMSVRMSVRMAPFVIAVLAFQLSPSCLTCASAADQNGVASVYSTESGGGTATGQKLTPETLTAAHRTLPFGTKVKVTNKSNGRFVVVTIKDRGPFVRGRIIDVSPAAARVLGFFGLAQVTITPGDTGNAGE